jgi:hypothetical protein
MRLQFLRTFYRRPAVMPLMRRLFQARAPQPPDAASLCGVRVLVVGVYLADRENSVAHLVGRYASSDGLIVEQRWACVGAPSDDAAVRAVTVIAEPQRTPKFTLLNRLLESVDLASYDHIVFSDDDIFVRRGFLAHYLGLVRHFGFAVAQPSRAWHSHFDHEFVLTRPFLAARETRFVEIGPVFSFDRLAAQALLPFDESSPMGWGYDHVWPAILAQRGLRMGIVDASRVDHSLRPQAVAYRKPEEAQKMQAYFATRPHIGRHEAQVRLRDHVLAPGERTPMGLLRRLLAALLDHDHRDAARD